MASYYADPYNFRRPTPKNVKARQKMLDKPQGFAVTFDSISQSDPLSL